MKLLRLALYGIVAAVILIIVLASVYLYVSSVTNATIQEYLSHRPVSGPIHGGASLSNTTILSYNNSADVVDYAIVHYNFTNVTSGQAVLTMFSTNPIKRIYLVNVGSACYKCLYSNPEYENLLYANLSQYLTTYGLIRNSSSLSEINLTGGFGTNVANAPPGSILIIPSGLIPCPLLPGLKCSTTNPANPNSTSIITLLKNGDVILYVGQNFNKAEDSGILLTNRTQNYQAALAVLNAYGINSTYPFYNATSSVSNSLYFNSPSFFFGKGGNYGPVTYVNTQGGSVVAFSNTSGTSWANINEMAHDMAVVLYERPWMYTLSQSNAYNISGKGALPLFTTKLPLQYNASYTNSEVNASYSLVDLKLYNATGFTTDELPFRLNFENNGTLGLPSEIGISQTIPISIYIGNVVVPFRKVPVANTSILFAVYIYNASMDYISSIYIGNINTPPISIVKPYTFTTFGPGYYIADLEDLSPRIYEKALFQIPYLNITPVFLDFRNGTFSFKVVNNNLSISGISYSSEINGAYKETGAINKGFINYTLPMGSAIHYGNQSFLLQILGINYSVNAYYQRPSGTTIPPIYIEFVIAAIGVILLNVVIKAPNRDEYFIDVPVFPPTEKVEVKVNPDSVLKIFDSINERFNWKYMPLTVEEVKAGVSYDIRYRNIPVMITMENAAEILYTLSSQGKIETIEPYFMPKGWVEKAKHDIEYLVVFRKLRDFAIKNAILFTDLYTAESADMVMTSKGVQNTVYIYSRASGMRDIRFGNRARAFIVFLNSQTTADFMEKLYSLYGTEAEELRTAIAIGSVTLIDTENLEPLLY